MKKDPLLDQLLKEDFYIGNDLNPLFKKALNREVTEWYLIGARDVSLDFQLKNKELLIELELPESRHLRFVKLEDLLKPLEDEDDEFIELCIASLRKIANKHEKTLL